MNTKIVYIYRDGSNYKAGNSFIVNGMISEEQKQLIISSCDDNEYFIPHQVGMPENRFEDINDDDHAWFELRGFELTNDFADSTMTVEELVQAFLNAKDCWNDNDWLL